MHTFIKLTLVVVMILGTTGQAQEREQVGNVDRVQNTVNAIYADVNRSLTASDPVWFKDLLKTGPDARLAVTLVDDSSLTLGENASLKVDAFVYSPDSGQLGLDVAQGAFLFIGGKLEDKPKASVNIKTPVATLGIRGTTVWGGPIDDAFGILTLKGAVTVSNAAGSVDLKAGEGTMIVAPDQAPSKPVTWPEGKVQRAVATITFTGN